MGKNSGLPTLDLHGFKKDDVVDAVDKFIMKHHHRERVRIMPGKGAGIVRQEVVRYLKQGGYPWAHEELPSGDKNTGVLVVFLA